MRQERATSSSGEHTGDTDGTRAGATGEGDSRAALPGAHLYLTRTDHLNNVDVHAPGKCPVMLQKRPDRLERNGVNIGYVRDEMRIAHRYGRNGKLTVAGLDRYVDRRV